MPTAHIATKYIAINPHLCTACWDCVDQCPNSVIGKVHFFRHQHAHIDKAEVCIGCKKCVKACSKQAISEIPHSTDSLSKPYHRNIHRHRKVTANVFCSYQANSERVIEIGGTRYDFFGV